MAEQRAGLVERKTFMELPEEPREEPLRSMSEPDLAAAAARDAAGSASDAAPQEAEEPPRLAASPAAGEESPPAAEHAEEAAEKKLRRGRKERAVYQSAEFSFKKIDSFDVLAHPDWRDHPSGRFYLQSVESLPEGASIAVMVCHRDGRTIGVGWVADFTGDGYFIGDAFVIEEFRGLSQLAEIIRWAIVWLFNDRNGKFKFKEVRGMRFPLINILGCTDDIKRIVKNVFGFFRYEEVDQHGADEFLRSVQSENFQNVAKLLNFEGRQWIFIENAMPWLPLLEQLKQLPKFLWPTKTQTAALTANTPETLSAEAVAQAPVRRSDFANGGNLTFEGDHAKLVVEAPNIHADGVIGPSGLEVDVSVYCKEQSVRKFKLGSARVEATASLWSKRQRRAEHEERPGHGPTPFQQTYPFSGVKELTRDALANPPVFSGRIKLKPVETEGANKKRMRLECRLRVACRAIREGASDTGIDFVAREFAEEVLFCVA